MKAGITLSMAAVVFFAFGGNVRADTRKAGDSLNYEVTLAQKFPVPASASKEQAKYFQDQPPAISTYTFSVAVDRVDPNGNAHAKISPHYKNVHIRGWTFPDFEGSVLPDGQIVPTVDLSVLKGSGLDTGSTVKPGYRPQTPEESVNFAAYGFGRQLLLFNDVALGAGKRNAFADGDSWRIVIPDQNNETVNFTYTGKQPFHGHDVVVLTVIAVEQTQNGPRTTTGTGYYDAVQKLLIGLHSEGEMDMPPLGAVGQKTDITLQP